MCDENLSANPCANGRCSSFCPSNCLDAGPPPVDGGPPADRTTPPPDVQDGGPLSCGDGGYYDEENGQCVDTSTDAYVPPPDADTDTYTPPPDAGPDGPTPPPPGIDFEVVALPGRKKILKNDPTTPSSIWAFTGPDRTDRPIKLLLCNPNDSRPRCELKADFTDVDGSSETILSEGMEPVDFVPVPDNGLGFAVAAQPSGQPTTVTRVDQNATNPIWAVPSADHHYSFVRWFHLTSGWESSATHPGEAVAILMDTPPPRHHEFFLTTAVNPLVLPFTEDVSFSTGEIVNPLRTTFPPGMSDGVNSSSLFSAWLAFEGEEEDTLVVLNSGPSDGSGRASISYFDPNHELEPRRPEDPEDDLGPGHAPIFRPDEDGTTAFIAFNGFPGGSVGRLVHYDLEAHEQIANIPLGGILVGGISGMDVSPERVCIGDDSGRVIFVERDDNARGYWPWPLPPVYVRWNSEHDTFFIADENGIGRANPPPETLRTR